MKIVFLDRDGVINKDPGFGGYVTCWEEFQFLPRALKALRKLNQAGYKTIIISNQAGVAKGLYTLEDLDEITKNMLDEIKKAGGEICSVHYCPHKDEDNCSCRKPKTGLFSQALRGSSIDFSKTYFIGDHSRDMLAGKSIGCKTIFVLSGNTRLEDLDVQPDFVAKDLLEAVESIVLKDENLDCIC